RAPAGRKIFVTDDRSGLARAILDALGDLGLSAVLVSADILSHRRGLPPAAGLLLVARPDGEEGERELRQAFELTRRLGPDLIESARLGGGFFATVTRLDGAAGFSGRRLSHPLQGALAGLAKTAAIEWPEVLCHALDLDPEWKDLRAAARAVVREALHRGPVEVGLGPDSRLVPRLVRRDDPPAGPLPLASGDAVIVTGGARGITAACVVELARQVRPALILLGRTPEPGAEPPWMQGLEEENDIRRALLREEFSASSARPAEAEKRLRGLLAAREVRHTLQALRDLGAPAAYMPVDVRDPDRLRAVIAEARDRFGPIRGLIHGAGVLEDRLILDKTLEQFDRVMGTKLGGFLALREALADEELRLLILFSSVTARFGNRGQADYAMANEALNKLARAEAQRRPGCRVLAINWGPWDCGMVTPAIRREFERQGVELLSAAQGAAALIAELRRPSDGQAVEVVIGGMRRPERAVVFAPRKAEGLRPLIERRLDPESHPVLRAHILGERAVVPLALIAEWLGEGALHENPGLVLQSLEEIRLLKGIRLETAPYAVRILAGKPRARNGGFEVDLELRGGEAESAETLHCRARAVLADSHPCPPAYRLPAGLSCNHYPRSPREVYEAILFHGELLQGLRWIQCCTAEGMVADVAAAPRPESWIESPLRRSWLGDPLALDAAFQMASLWSWEMKGAVSLPSAAACFRLYREAWPPEGCQVVFEIRSASDRTVRGDFVFLDAGRKAIAQISGFEAVIDPSLNRAFKPGGIRAAPLGAREGALPPRAQSGSRS
ncbi:MAG: SDR family NAD(P)-dependent oxidoreductase, partial [Desulfobacterales bacterium]